MTLLTAVTFISEGVAEVINRLDNKPFDENDETLFEVSATSISTIAAVVIVGIVVAYIISIPGIKPEAPQVQARVLPLLHPADNLLVIMNSSL